MASAGRLSTQLDAGGLIHQRSFEVTCSVDARTIEDRIDATSQMGKGIRGQGGPRWSVEGSLGYRQVRNQTPYTISIWFHPTRSKMGPSFPIEDGVGARAINLLTMPDTSYLFISQATRGVWVLRVLNPTEKHWYHLTITYDASMSARGLSFHRCRACCMPHNSTTQSGAVSSQPFESESVPWLSTSSECGRTAHL